MKLTIQAHKRGKKRHPRERNDNLQSLCTKSLSELRLDGAGRDGVKIRFEVEKVNQGGNYDGEISLDISEIYALLAVAHEQLKKSDVTVDRRLDRLEKEAGLPRLPLKLTIPKAAQ